MLTFLRLLTAHLAGDFVLQPSALVKRKSSLRWLLVHVAIHAGLYTVLLQPRAMTETTYLAVTLAVLHGAIDYGKARFRTDGAIAFCVDQMAHFISIVAVAAVAPTMPLHAWRLLTQAVQSPQLYLFSSGYIAIVFGASHLVQRVSGHFLADLDRNTRATKPGLRDAGKYIGWLERFLIVTFLLARHGDVIALVIGAKAVIRYPELKDVGKGHFADYFLIGTMTSVGLALAGGLALLYVSARIP